MVDLSKLAGFEWDKWNIDKSYQKHGISLNEAEEPFLDKELLMQEDIKHSQKEERFILIGKSFKKIILCIAFTIRENKVRIISARKANIKERRRYAKKT